MSDLPVRVLSIAELNKALLVLSRLLKGLPATIPLSNDHYNFETYAPSEASLELCECEDGAVNRDLECTFCPQGRTNGIVLQERGPGLETVTKVLRMYTTKYPQNVVLQKWITDLSAAARAHGAAAPQAPAEVDHWVSGELYYEDLNALLEDAGASSEGALDVPETSEPASDSGSGSESEMEGVEATGPARPGSSAKPRKKRRASQSTSQPRRAKRPKKLKTSEIAAIANAKVIEEYEDIPRPVSSYRGGRPRLSLLDKVAVYTTLKDDPNKVPYWRCVGAVAGCDKRWKGKSDRQRILSHTANCNYVDRTLRQEVNAWLGAKSLGADLGVDDPGSNSETLLPKSTTPAPSAAPDVRSASIPAIFQPRPTSGTVASSASKSVSTGSQARASGSEATASTKPSRQPSVYAIARKGARDKDRDAIDFAIMRWFVVAGVPPSRANHRAWKDLWAIAKPGYEPASGSTLEDRHIPLEAARVKEASIQQLRELDDLTITYDGGTTKGQESVYTVHVSTSGPDRQTFLIEGDEASFESHDSEHIYKLLKGVVETIGPTRFRGISSDNTKNTKGARRLLCKDYPWLQILPDPCHRLSSLCKDICKHQHFKPIIKHVRKTVKFFKKSTFGKSHLRRRRQKLKIGRGVVSIGKTRFGTMWHSSESVRRCLPAIEGLCREKIVTIKGVNHLFMSGMANEQFKFQLAELTTILAPIAKSITCLESAQSTVSDVYVFWLAVMAELHDILTDPSSGMETSVKEHIRRCANQHFKEMIEASDEAGDVYLTGFIFDPRYRGADILRDLNPLAIAKIKIGPQSAAKDKTRNRLGSSGAESLEADGSELPKSLRRAGGHLMNMLKLEYMERKVSIAGLSEYDAFERLPDQVRRYIKTHSLFTMTPNSMNDERTGSAFTWLNTSLRNRMKVATLVRHVQLQQYFRTQYKTDKSPIRRPTVKFRDLNTLIHKKPSRGAGPRSATAGKRKEMASDGSADDEVSSDSESDGGEGGMDDSSDDELETDSETIDEVEMPSGELLAGRVANLTASSLRNLLSDTPIESAMPQPSKSTVSSQTVASRPQKAPDWVFR
ncbi:hypothetical protein EVJ58_g6337 [Rhodofomes roseus]|uniref:DUF659 domain-containing protein n=1 Tax=Rhodofomes roseus TaxID=34475 RepID=A0A4Y9YA11_9APHY|nr:hypothetical protein EVJ58_g6337 [Rhodofomes roseus]